jgi:hypothetical protein
LSKKHEVYLFGVIAALWWRRYGWCPRGMYGQNQNSIELTQSVDKPFNLGGSRTRF